MLLAMKNTGIDYIPGCVELGDFDATSTTVGIYPCGELGNIPEPQLHHTFDRYFQFCMGRINGNISWENYTPYELRTVGTFMYLDQRDRAHAMLNFFMKDRRPSGWNHWAEVVWRKPETARFIGDMPHTWVGSDFIRSVRSMFVYERESDFAMVIGAGVPESWINGEEGVKVSGLYTYYGKLDFDIKMEDNSLFVNLSGDIKVPGGGIIIKSPVSKPITSLKINSELIRISENEELIIRQIPAHVEIQF
jgi:hypothetical protein